MARNRRNLFKHAQEWYRKSLHLRRGSCYEPFITVRDVASQGWRYQLKSWTCERLHHFLSKNEYRLFLLLDVNPRVTDIREQYPLLPVEETHRIAAALGVKHSKNGKEVVYTTDAVVTIDGRDIALYFKNTKDLLNSRTIEKLVVERSYWNARNVPFYVVTERDLDIQMADSVKGYHPYRYEKFDGIPTDTVSRALRKILLKSILESDLKLSEICSSVDESLGLSHGQSLALVKRELANQRLKLEKGEYFAPDEPLKLRVEKHA